MKIEVEVHPRAKKEEIRGEGSYLQVWVREVPEKGKANRRVIELVAEKLGVPKSRIEIIHGQKGKRKILKVEDA